MVVTDAGTAGSGCGLLGASSLPLSESETPIRFPIIEHGRNGLLLWQIHALALAWAAD